MRIFSTSLRTVSGLMLFVLSNQAMAAQNALDSAADLTKNGHPEQALEIVEPIISKAMLSDAKEANAICPGTAVAALQSFMKGFTITVENDWCTAMLVKAYALNELKRPKEAEQVLANLVGHDPQNPNYLGEYAYTVRVNGNLERSLELYKQAEKYSSRYSDRQTSRHWRAVALRGQGYVLSDQGRWDEAMKAYQRSLKYEPDNPIALNEMKYIEDNRPRK